MELTFMELFLKEIRKRENEATLEEHKKANAEIDAEGGMLSRVTAVEIFEDLSGYVDSGHMPPNVSPYAVGRAVQRTINNNGLDSSHNSSELLRGLFPLDEDQRKQVMELINSMLEENEAQVSETREELGDRLGQ